MPAASSSASSWEPSAVLHGASAMSHWTQAETGGSITLQSFLTVAMCHHASAVLKCLHMTRTRTVTKTCWLQANTVFRLTEFLSSETLIVCSGPVLETQCQVQLTDLSAHIHWVKLICSVSGLVEVFESGNYQTVQDTELCRTLTSPVHPTFPRFPELRCKISTTDSSFL